MKDKDHTVKRILVPFVLGLVAMAWALGSNSPQAAAAFYVPSPISGSKRGPGTTTPAC